MQNHLGIQLMVEMYGCDKSLLDDQSFIEKSMLIAAKKANATVVQQYFHQFSPYGISGTVVIAESHINIHTWPEYSYAAVDIFTCGDTLDADAAISFLSEAFKVKKVETSKHLRGDQRTIKKVNA